MAKGSSSRKDEKTLLNLDDKPLEVRIQQPKGMSTTKADRSKLKDKIIVEKTRIKKPKNSSLMSKDSSKSRVGVKSKFMTQLSPSSDHSVDKRRALMTEDQQYDIIPATLPP